MIQHSNNRLEQRLDGAYVDLETLISSRFAAKDLQLTQRRRALSLLAGPNKTNFRGRGIEFEEVRAYQSGDDIRSIDWRVTARSDRAYTKLFREERERPLLVVTDQRQPMFFGSQCCFKSVMACYLSALIAWAGLQQGDRVGGVVFGNDTAHDIRPRRNRQAVLSLINTMLESNRQLNRSTGVDLAHGDSLAQAFADLRRIAKPGSAIYIVSDFSGFNDSNAQKHLHQLSRHCEITGLLVFDPMEQQLPPPGHYTVTDGRHRSPVQTDSRAIRQRYTRQFTDKLSQLHQQLGRLGIPLIEIRTDQAPLKCLSAYYGNRPQR